jgi:hypothetical protein
MPPIFINTTELSKADVEAKKKIFEASKAGGASAEVEALMKKTVVDLLVNNAKFTTNKYKDAKGYTLKMEITSVKVDAAGNTSTTMSTIIERYPDGNVASVGGTSKASLGPPADKQAILECAKAMVKGALEKSLPIMSEDNVKHR